MGLVNYCVDDEHEWTQNTAMWNPAGDAMISRINVCRGKRQINRICLLSNF